MVQHSLRLCDALITPRLKTWPFDGPALLSEGGGVDHVVDAWCYLGTVSSDAEVAALLEKGKPCFD